MTGIAIMISMFEMFLFGLMIGYEASKRSDPNQPKPKKWDELAHKEWMKGFKAGEKSMMKRMGERLKTEEIYAEMTKEG